MGHPVPGVQVQFCLGSLTIRIKERSKDDTKKK